MKSKLILSLLALSLLPVQLCAMSHGSQTMTHEITLSPKNVEVLKEILKGSGGQINDTVTDFLKTLNQGVKEEVKPALAELGKGGSDALANLRPGIGQIGEGIADSIRPVHSEIIKIMAKYTALSLGATLIGIYVKKYVDKYLFEPKLIEKQSSHWISKSFSSLFYGKPEIKLEDHMIISDVLSKDLNYIMKMTKNIKKNGGHFEHVLLYGEPGTGKTLFAQLLAEDCGMDYAFVPAANVSKFLTKNTTSAAAHELDELFAWAAGRSNGTILFFDEAETFLADRSTLSIEAQNALAAFLAKTGTPSNKIMIICATNRPEIMDSAVLSRLGYQVEFPLPDLKAREAQLKMHIKKIFTKQEGKQISYKVLQDPALLNRFAQELEGCSGRSIQKAVNRLRQTALAEDVSEITPEIMQRVVQQMQKDRVKPSVVARAA